MKVTVSYYSWFRDHSGVSSEEVEITESASTLGDLLNAVHKIHPSLKESERSTLMAVGVEYQDANHPLKDGDQVSLFPPVQGG